MKIKDLFKKNTALKAVSLSLALLLWFYAATEQKVEVRMNGECSFINIKDSLAIAKVNPQSFDILVKGKSRDFLIMKILNRKPSLTINLSSLDKGKHEYQILKDSIKLKSSGNVFVSAINSSKTIEFEIDSLREKDVLVSPVITGRPFEGYVISGEVKVVPQRVKITGAKKILESIKSIETKEISIKDKKSRVQKKSMLDIGDDLFSTQSTNVIVSIPIDIAKTKEFKSVPVIFVNKKKDIRIFPDSATVDIIISGPESIISEMLAGEVSPIIDISHITKKKEYYVDISIPKQKYIEVISITPRMIKIEAK